MDIQQIDIKQIKPYENNPRKNDKAVDKVAESIKTFGFNQPIVVDQNMEIIVGHTRYKAAKKLGLITVPTVVIQDLDPGRVKAYRLADNKLNELAEWDDQLLLEELKSVVEHLGSSDITGFDYNDMLIKSQTKTDEWKSLSDKFLVPPFSILDAKSGRWQKRKNIWKSMGIKSEIGRDATCMASGSYLESGNNGISIFDPVLTELMYLWYCPHGGLILDPFAGGSVRGIVAKMLGRSYTGIDLRSEQITANNQNWAELKQQGKDTLARYKCEVEPTLTWITGDSNVVLDTIDNDTYDLLFTCPPYADLEVYSDDPADISNMNYCDFITIYRSIVKKSVEKLKNNRFAVVVVGEVRSDTGSYYNFVGDTIKAYVDAGMSYYNEAILITPTATIGMTCKRPFETGRKLAKAHQNALIFVKGEGKEAKTEIDQISLAWHQHDENATLTEHHEKILMFVKGDSKEAAKNCGDIEVDTLDIIADDHLFMTVNDNLSELLNLDRKI